MEMQRYAPQLFDRLIDDHRGPVPATCTLAHLKDAVAVLLTNERHEPRLQARREW